MFKLNIYCVIIKIYKLKLHLFLSYEIKYLYLYIIYLGNSKYVL